MSASVINPSTPYRAHRERQRRRILAAAWELFDARGIDRVTVAEIVTAAGIRASTFYEYFPNKDEIVWALVEETMVASAERARRATESAAGPVLGRIAALLGAFAEELREEPARVRFMAQFDAMYAREWTAERLMALEEKISFRWLIGMEELIREGIADGSLRPDLDPRLTLHAVLNAVAGTQRRLASLGERVETEFGQPVEAIFREAVRVILLGLAASAEDEQQR